MRMPVHTRKKFCADISVDVGQFAVCRRIDLGRRFYQSMEDLWRTPGSAAHLALRLAASARIAGSIHSWIVALRLIR